MQNSIKSDCSVKNVHISQFQNPLQTKFNLHISLCQGQIEKTTISGDPVLYIIRQCVFETFMEITQKPPRQFQKIGMQGEHIRFRSRLKF